MNKFNNLYKLIKESIFPDKKWKFYATIDNIDVYVNFEHVKKQLTDRYKPQNNSNFLFSRFVSDLITYIKKYDIFEKAITIGNNRGFTFHRTSLNFYMSGVLQKDKIDNVNRIYISTVLPQNTTYHNKHDIFIEI